MILNNRIIWSDNSTLKDLGVNLNNFHSGEENIPIIAAEDKIFFGSILPFNHKWFEIGAVPNAAAAKISAIEVWDGDEWHEVAEIIDQTSLAGATFAQSGYVSWVPDKEEGWRRDDTRDTDGSIDPIIGLGNSTGVEAVTNPITIYDLYWNRFIFDSDLTAGTTLKFVGHKFSTIDDLGDIYPDLIKPNVIAQFESGKTDWKEQEFVAARQIIADLERDAVIKTRDNILNWERFTRASIEKIAEIAFKAFGDDWADNRKLARDSYWSALNSGKKEIDRNRNARKDPQESIDSQGEMFR